MFGAIFDQLTLARRLVDLGWLPNVGIAPGKAETAEAVSRYQEHYGLPACGKVDGTTERHLCACRTCRFPDVMAVADELQKWPKGMVVTWFMETVPSRFGRTAAEAAYIAATKAWMSCCGVKFEPTTNPKTARLTVRFDGIDGAGRVLGYSDLPDDKGSPRLQRFDHEENWVISEKPKLGEIDFLRVATHELGHILGIGHISAGNLLQPMYDLNIRGPKAGDVHEAIARYGPSTDPNTGTIVPPATPTRIVVEIEGDVKTVLVAGLDVGKVSVKTTN